MLIIGVIAMALLLAGEQILPGKPVALGVVALSIIAASALGLPHFGVPITGDIPSGLPALSGPALRLRDVEGIVPLAAGCLLLAYVESISAARTLAAKHGYAIDPRRNSSASEWPISPRPWDRATRSRGVSRNRW